MKRELREEKEKSTLTDHWFKQLTGYAARCLSPGEFQAR